MYREGGSSIHSIYPSGDFEWPDGGEPLTSLASKYNCLCFFSLEDLKAHQEKLLIKFI